jgi:lysophospholipase L1-like esterase
VDRIVDVQREIARDSGCAFLDLRAKLGGKGSMHSWFVAGLAQYDHVHFTAEGYRLIANLMFRDLISQYQVFLKAREQ